MAVSVLYSFPITAFGTALLGVTTPATVQQAAVVQEQAAQISFLDADAFAAFTHNWGLGASSPSYFHPQVSVALIQASPLGGTNMPAFTYSWANTNVLQIGKVGGAGTGGTYAFWIRRPHTTGQ